MKRILCLLLLATLVTPLSLAQQPKRTKRQKVVSFLVGPWKDWKFMVVMAPLAVGMALDGESTTRLQRRRPGAVELNPFLGEHPTPKQISAYMAIVFVGQTYATWGFKTLAYDPARPKDKFQYIYGVYPAAVGALHGDAARKNYNLVTCPSGTFKPPGLPGCVLR